ncbi:hypothetical protein J6590_069263 [Homalodisca vitripennis]|nr:hypothetical protein J6590_069263 [Homalodisca vitripennis]
MFFGVGRTTNQAYSRNIFFWDDSFSKCNVLADFPSDLCNRIKSRTPCLRLVLIHSSSLPANRRDARNQILSGADHESISPAGAQRVRDKSTKYVLLPKDATRIKPSASEEAHCNDKSPVKVASCGLGTLPHFLLSMIYGVTEAARSRKSSIAIIVRAAFYCSNDGSLGIKAILINVLKRRGHELLKYLGCIEIGSFEDHGDDKRLPTGRKGSLPLDRRFTENEDG